MFKTIGIVLLMAVCLLPLYYEFPGLYPASAQVVTFENNKVNLHPYGTFVWEWDEFVNAPTSSEYAYFGSNVRNEVKNSVTIRTVNPKVRKISYSVVVYISDLEEFYSSPSRRIHSASSTQKMINRVAREYLYEFNNNQSKNLEDFYNPLKTNQQEAFKQLLGQWMNERLKHTGIQVKINPFWIDDVHIS